MTVCALVILDEPRADPVACFIERCEARAALWQLGAIDLQEAVDGLQADAERDGLTLGQDAVQEIMAAAFGAVRSDE